MSSINRAFEVLRVKRKTDTKEVYVIKQRNDRDISLSNLQTGLSNIVFYANMYELFTIYAEVNSSDEYQYVELYITDRFTMNSYRKQITLTAGGEAYHLIDDTHILVRTMLSTVAGNVYRVMVFVPVTDITCGNICALFYKTAAERDKFTPPIIVDVNNAPSVYMNNMYKWHPHNNSDAVDYDNIFNDTFGEFWDKSTGKRDVPDSGRVDVLSAGGSTEYYNDFLNADRLITNGIRYWEAGDSPNSVLESISGHPIYNVIFETFVPQSITDMYGDKTHKLVGFAPVALHEEALGSNCCAYLTTSGNYSTHIDDADDAFNVRIVQVTSDTDPAHSAKVLTAVRYGNDDYTITGHYQRFNTYLGCISGKRAAEHITDGNGTLYDDRPDDAWFREHTMFHADFELSGIADEWMRDDIDPEVPVISVVTDRSYYIFGDVRYTPPVFELTWFCAGDGTSYYLVKKCPEGQDRTTWINNNNNWIQVFTKENRSEYLLNERTICADGRTLMCKPNDPILENVHYTPKLINDASECIVDNLPEIELDSQDRPLVVHENYSRTGVLHGSYHFSENNSMFRVMDEKIENHLHLVIYRISDNGGSFDSEFSLANADAEFAIIYPA